MSRAQLARLDGNLVFGTANQKLSELLAFIQENESKELHISMAEVSNTDSAGLAVMIEGMRVANKHGKLLRYIHVPAHLQALARFCCLDFIIDENQFISKKEK